MRASTDEGKGFSLERTRTPFPPFFLTAGAMQAVARASRALAASRAPHACGSGALRRAATSAAVLPPPPPKKPSGAAAAARASSPPPPLPEVSWRKAANNSVTLTGRAGTAVERTDYPQSGARRATFRLAVRTLLSAARREAKPEAPADTIWCARRAAQARACGSRACRLACLLCWWRKWHRSTGEGLSLRASLSVLTWQLPLRAGSPWRRGGPTLSTNWRRTWPWASSCA
jgi:hypothetical protein